MEIKTNIAELKGPAPLYCQSPHESEPFPAYLQIDPVRRVVTFGVNGDPRAMAENVYRGQVYRVEIPNNLTADRIGSLFRVHLPRIQTIVAGYGEVLDQYGDGVGRLSVEAQEALAELQDELAGMDASVGPAVYNSPEEYFDIFDYVQADTSDEALQRTAAEIRADQEVVFADGADQKDILAALIAKRTELRDAED